jgi:hypothetical protein
MKTKLELRVKDGNGGVRILPAGLPVTFSKEKPSVCFITHESREKPYCVRITSAFRAPSLKKLEEWTFDSICESVGGENVEPDGWDSNGSPSWLLAIGMI